MTMQDNTPNHPYVVKIEYQSGLPFHDFCDDREIAREIAENIADAIAAGSRMLKLSESLYITLENVRSVSIIDKGTDYSDMKWLG